MTCKLQHGPASPVYVVDGEGSAVGMPIGSDWTVTNAMSVTNDNSNKTWTVPAGQEWQILWIQVLMVTSATAGTRQMEVRVDRSAVMTPIGRLATAGITQAASTTRRYMFAPGLADLTAVRDTDKVYTPIPVTTILQAGDILRVWDNGARDPAADDMWVTVQYAYREV